ncbi:MAG: 3-hydroxyacyl-CoA dehydrogenase NAD-binding domain-containing protein, partial [Beijerinckiaceae bacterium]
PDVMNRIEACKKPVVVAWHGTALGGGCELGLAAHARVIAQDGKVGLPEVKLGLIPGAGGTQRLPRVIGTAAAIDLITSGRMVSAKEALSIGLVDEIAAGDVRAAAIAKARALAGQPVRRSGTLRPAGEDDNAAQEQEKAALKKARGQTAPGEAIRLIKQAATTDIQNGMTEERRTFLALMAGEQSRALRHVFFAEREVAKVPGLAGVQARPVQSVGVIGAGTMGAGIAVAFMDAGYAVTIIETSAEALAKGQERITGLYARSVKSGRMTPEAMAARLAQARFETQRETLADTDLVIEAVFEDMAVKIDLLTHLEKIVRPDCILATNTSYLDINAMADSLKQPGNLVGLHFFSPANIMRLLEIVRAAKTAPEVLATAVAVGKKLGKISVVSGVCDGFIGNRILAKYRAQCEFMLEEGALPQDIDAALEQYGFAMGPFAVQDLAGLDIAWARRKRLAPTRSKDERYVPLADMLCEQGRFGQKTAAGWYRYDGGKRVIDPTTDAMVRAHQKACGRPQRAFSADEIVGRALAVMANEGARIVEEGIAARPLDVDIVLINGYGYPAYKGGPMFAANEKGWPTIEAQLSALAQADGEAFAPSDLIKRLARGETAMAQLNTGQK